MLKTVNYTRGIYFFVAFFGIALFFGMLFLAPQTVSAPEGTFVVEQTADLSHFGKPAENNLPETIPSNIPETSAADDVSTPNTHIIFTGDIMLARAVEWAIKENGADYPFALWDRQNFSDADAVIGNFEGTLRADEHIEQTNVMAFDTLPDYTLPLTSAGFTHVSLANNHADDFGQTTTDFTRSTLTANGLAPFGDPFAGEDFVAHIAGDIPVSLIGFHAFNEEAEGIVEAIRAEKASGNFVIIYPHWGTEYEHVPSSYQTTAADLWIAAGADLIIGSHPHVVQSVETRSDVPVVYSLGNFLFDQDFSLDTKIGAMVDVNITDHDITFAFSPVRITARQMFVSHADDETLRAWLGLDTLTWTVLRNDTY